MPTLRMRGKNYDGDGRCIYCLKTFPKELLTHEHIVPDALHGSLLFRDAVCEDCRATSNNAYENIALNKDLLLPRLLLELRGKKGTKATQDLRHLPKVYPGDVTEEELGEPLTNFPIEMYPKWFGLPVFPRPGILTGTSRGGELLIAEFKTQLFIMPGKSLQNVTTRPQMSNGPFAKMIAKIAYCYAAAERGLDAFDGQPIRDLLNGSRDDVYNFVGSEQSMAVLLTKRHFHSLYIRECGEWLTVLVHLFASIPRGPVDTIPYEVVVGRIM